MRLFQQEVQRVFSGAGLFFEIVFVDDGSRDDTLPRLNAMFEESVCPMQIISFTRNFGKEAAMLAGLKAARGEYITLIDGDLQQRPEVALEMLRILQTSPEYDCVAAYQSKRKESFFQKNLKFLFYKMINRFSDVDFVANASDFRTMRRQVVKALLELTEYHRFSKGLFSWVGFSTKYIPYEAQERVGGKTKWSLVKLLRYAWDGILSFSTAPIKMAICLGGGCAALAFLYMVVILIQKLFFSIAVPGYATIVCLILFIGGLQLFFQGILGEYIGRIYIQTKHRPVYLVRGHKTWETREREKGPL